MQPKTIAVPLKDGTTCEAVQRATFAEYIDGKQFRFVVTMLEGFSLAVTHRASGIRVCSIPPTMPTFTQAQCAAAGRKCLRQLVERVGDGRVAAKLTEAEGA